MFFSRLTDRFTVRVIINSCKEFWHLLGRIGTAFPVRKKNLHACDHQKTRPPAGDPRREKIRKRLLIN